MRISAKIMADNIKANLAKQSTQLMKTQLKIASGKRINRPSDDHIGIGKVLGYRSTLSTIDQYRENITDAQTRVKYTETILGQIHDFLREAKSIASYPGTDDKTPIAEAIKDIRDQTLGLANSKYGKNYLFSGHLSDTPAFDPATYVYNGDGGLHRVINRGWDYRRARSRRQPDVYRERRQPVSGARRPGSGVDCRRPGGYSGCS